MHPDLREITYTIKQQAFIPTLAWHARQCYSIACLSLNHYVRKLLGRKCLGFPSVRSDLPETRFKASDDDTWQQAS